MGEQTTKGRRASDYDMDQGAADEWISVLDEARRKLVKRLMGDVSEPPNGMVATVRLAEDIDHVLRNNLRDVVLKDATIGKVVDQLLSDEKIEPLGSWQRAEGYRLKTK